MTTKTLEHYKAILGAMQPDVWYKAAEFTNTVTVRESRIKVLLGNLVDAGKLEETGSTKGKMYRKKR